MALTARANTPGTLTACVRTQIPLTARADTQRTLTARANTQRTLTARADTQMTLIARAKTQTKLAARADTQLTLTAHTDTQMTPIVRADTQMTPTVCADTHMTLQAPSSACAPSSSPSSPRLILLLFCSFSIFLCLLINVSLISFASSAPSSGPSPSLSLHLLPSCSSSASSSLVSCVALHTQDRQKKLTSDLNQTKFNSNSLQKGDSHIKLFDFLFFVDIPILPYAVGTRGYPRRCRGACCGRRQPTMENGCPRRGRRTGHTRRGR